MKSLYTRLAEQWDTLFPPDRQRERFLLDLLEGDSPGRVVEVGCGTGATSLALAENRYRMYGSDLDSEMISIASAKGSATATFTVEDMLGALEGHSRSESDAVLCLGNTLPHLKSADEIALFFTLSTRVLSPGGHLVIQILNYQRIMNVGEITMPEIQGDGILFRRRQKYLENEGCVLFETEVLGEELSEKRAHWMLPVEKAVLEEISRAAGLRMTGFYDSWEASPARDESPWFVYVFEKVGTR